jgi:hypothetical protein
MAFSRTLFCFEPRDRATLNFGNCKFDFALGRFPFDDALSAKERQQVKSLSKCDRRCYPDIALHDRSSYFPALQPFEVGKNR